MANQVAKFNVEILLNAFFFLVSYYGNNSISYDILF